MRKLIATEIKGSPGLHTLINRRYYAANALGVESIPEKPKKPFVVGREFEQVPFHIAKDTQPHIHRVPWQFYVHDERGSYNRIDLIIDQLRETVIGLTDRVSDTGSRCLEVVWSGTSADLEDPTYDSFMKFATFTLVSTK